MRQVARFYLDNFTKNDFEIFYKRSTLFKLRKVCMFRIDSNFNPAVLFELKALIKHFKSKKKAICLDIRDSVNHGAILDLIELVDTIKVKYEYVKDHAKLSELLAKANRLAIPVILYLKTDSLKSFIELYRNSDYHYSGMVKVIDIQSINPLEAVQVLNDESVYFLDCPICVTERIGVRSCTSGILDIYMNVRKVGKKVKFEEINQAEEAKFFKKSSFCENCICGCRCLGNRLETVTPSVIIRNEETYESATGIFEKLIDNLQRKQ